MIVISKPVLQNQNAFTALSLQLFPFSYNGAQVTKNRLRIYKNETNELIYDQTQTTFALYHSLPANTLTNGMLYNADLQVYDGSNNASSFSNKIIFYCYSTPAWTFNNMTENQLVQNSSFSPSLSYSQSEGELLASYHVQLYDAGKNLLYDSGMKYPSENMGATFSGLDDSTEYYVKSDGITVNGMIVSTGYVKFTVSYVQASMFSKVEIKNMPEYGYIKLASHLVIITGVATPDPPTYINDTMIDLSVEGHCVRFSEGFFISDNFSLEMIGKQYNPYSEILNMATKDGTISIKYMLGTFAGQTQQQAYFVLEVTNGITSYITATAPFTVTTDNIKLRLKKKNNIYELKIE